jgi:hypothetical protein
VAGSGGVAYTSVRKFKEQGTGMYAFAVLWLLAAQSGASVEPATIEAFVPEGWEMTQRLDADLDGDRRVDTALLLTRVDDQDDHSRRLLVLMARDGSLWAAGQVALEMHPEAPVLTAKRGVLVLEYEQGGASNSMMGTYRYRYEPTSRRMRMIGVDLSSYSRTNSVDAVEISANLLTGDRIVKRSEVIDEGPDGSELALDERAYRDPVETRSRVAPNRWYMEDTQDPWELFEAMNAVRNADGR